MVLIFELKRLLGGCRVGGWRRGLARQHLAHGGGLVLVVTVAAYVHRSTQGRPTEVIVVIIIRIVRKIVIFLKLRATCILRIRILGF